MLLSTDKTGFPLLVISEAELEVHLLPITKLQFAQFVEESSTFDPACYQDLLALNPETSAARLDRHNREQLFISGIKPQEARTFAQWMGDGFDLPTLAEWRIIYAAMRRERFPLSKMFFDWTTDNVATIVKKLLNHHPRRRMHDIMLMRGGLVEWVHHEGNWAGLGAPQPSFQPNLWDPTSNIIRPFKNDRRLHYFGFRLVRRGQWDSANKSGGIYLF